MTISKQLHTELLLGEIKTSFEQQLSKNLELYKVSCPLAVIDGTGIDDDLNGIERPVKFPIKFLNEKKAVVVHSLAKWKRVQLKKLEIKEGKGIVTDMKALRPDEDYSPIHSILVDQWDWETHISKQDRTLSFLRNTVEKIYESILETEKKLSEIDAEYSAFLPKKIHFIHTEELIKKYPNTDPKEREDRIAKEYGAVFLIGIGGKLSDGQTHDGRALDYDDWSSENEDGFYGLNGDLLVWNPTLQKAFEISSMGIRVDKESLKKQFVLNHKKEEDFLDFHHLILNDEVPLSIGGGIGQSRLCMLLLRKKHIKEVQIGIWE